MNTFKKVMLTTAGIIVVAVLVSFFAHIPQTDRFDPSTQKTTNCAKVKKGTQNCYQAQITDPKTDEDLSYKFSEVGGYDSSKEYTEITHRGQYVEKINCISKEKSEKAKQK